MVAVYGLYTMELVQLIMATHDAFETLGRGWGNTSTLNNPQWLWFDVPLMSGIGRHHSIRHLWCRQLIASWLVSASVQIYFAWRIYVLSRSKILSGCIVMVRSPLLAPLLASTCWLHL